MPTVLITLIPKYNRTHCYQLFKNEHELIEFYLRSCSYRAVNNVSIIKPEHLKLYRVIMVGCFKIHKKVDIPFYYFEPLTF
jgi:hypothetical protein